MPFDFCNFQAFFQAPFEPGSENSPKRVAKWTPMSQSWHSGQSGASVNGPKWFPTPKHIGPFTQIKSLASPGAKIEIYTLKGSWTSYSSYSPFLTFMSIWCFWQWSQLIPHTQKHGDRHQNQVSSITTSKVRKLHPEGVPDLLQPLHPVLDLQVDLRTLAMVPTDSSYPKTWG